MCGIFGYVGKGGNPYKIAMLAMFNDSRGGDATGIYTPETGVIKQPVDAGRFVGTIATKLPTSVSIALGHTRYATHGKNTQDNAHPFKVGEIVGTHNGVISNYSAIAKEYGHDVHAVDSMAIFQALSSEKRSNWVYLLPRILGGIAIAFEHGGRLFLYRRDNPIFVGLGDKGLYYSSTKASLEGIGLENVSELDPHVLHSIDSKLTWGKEKVKKAKAAPTINWTDYKDDYKSYYPATGKATAMVSSVTKSNRLFDDFDIYDDHNRAHEGYAPTLSYSQESTLNYIILTLRKYKNEELREAAIMLEDLLMDSGCY